MRGHRPATASFAFKLFTQLQHLSRTARFCRKAPDVKYSRGTRRLAVHSLVRLTIGMAGRPWPGWTRLPWLPWLPWIPWPCVCSLALLLMTGRAEPSQAKSTGAAEQSRAEQCGAQPSSCQALGGNHPSLLGAVRSGLRPDLSQILFSIWKMDQLGSGWLGCKTDADNNTRQCLERSEIGRSQPVADG